MGAPHVQVIGSDLGLLAVTDDYASLIWTERWNEPGDFEIVVPLSEVNLSLFREDRFLRPFGTPKLGIIERVDASGDAEGQGTLKVSGRDALSILGRRVIQGTVSVNGLASTFASRCLSRNLGDEAQYARQIPAIGIGDLTALDAGGSSHRVATYRNLLDKLCSVADASQCAVSADYDGTAEKIMITAKARRTRSDLVFSEGRLNLLSSRYSCDSTALVTDQTVGGAGEGDERVYGSYSDSTYVGLERHEAYADRRDLAREMTLSDAFERFVPPTASYSGVKLEDYGPVWETDASGTTVLADITATAVAYYRIATDRPIASEKISMREVYCDGRSAQEQEAFCLMLDGMKALYDQYSPSDPTLAIDTVISASGVTLRWEGDSVVTPAYDSWDFDPTEAMPADGEVTVEADKYALMLAELAKEQWSGGRRLRAFDGKPDMSMLRYREDWALGDVCLFRTRYGLSVQALIVEAVETWDSSGYSVTPGFTWAV